MVEWNYNHLEILAKMIRGKVTGGKHVQTDTLKSDWVNNMEGDEFEEAIEDLITSPQAPVRQKGRGTVQLTSIAEAKQVVEEHDDDGEFTWYL